MIKHTKYLSVFLVISILFLSIVCYVPIAHASIEAKITGDEVRLRSGAGTNFSQILLLNKGYTVTLNDTNLVSGVGCSAGWYHVYYNGKNGYVCSSYVDTSGKPIEDSLGRPWVSPKKAIIGGASFIASGYILKGQNTSYLKKFNVNPNSYYTVYKHQYMANLAAPNNEAGTSYKSYKANGLLSLPLHFMIPIFENMPEYTTHPVTGREIGGTSVVTDQAFEKKLDEQKFPETYKVWLRSLHNKYPNWTFSSIITGLDFNVSVEEEKWVSSINSKTCPKCVDASNTWTEGDWYVGSTEVTAYFLDPRNFLEENSILMFEELVFAEHYTEDAVKSILSSTFMSGNDHVDNISYSSIFVEAGRVNNVNPVYLASLSRQEVGVNGGIVTSGEKFEYKGITYQGFYNFYNIGAYSSEEDPAKAGLVYAAFGSSSNQDGIYVGNIGGSTNPGDNNNNNNDTNTPSLTPVKTHISRMELNLKGNFLTNVSLNSTVQSLKNKTIAGEVSFKNASMTNEVGNTEKVGTGMNVVFKTGESYKVVVYGDLTGDGVINSADLLRMRQYLLGQVNLQGAYLEAARLVNTSGKVNSADLLRMRQYLLGQKGISQL